MPSDQLTPAAVTAAVEKMARTMVADVSVAEILEDLVVRLVSLLPVTGAGVSFVFEQRAPVQVAASDEVARELESLQSQLGEGPCVVAHETGAPCVVADVRRESRFPSFNERAAAIGLGAVFAFPLRLGERALGAVDLYRDTPGELSVDEIAAASMIAGVVSALLLNAQQRADLEILAASLGIAARRDPLTHLANRTAMLERLELAVKRWERSGRLFLVLFLDIDNFKAVNDRYGHAAGDQLLEMFATRLSSMMRPIDLTARLGGDEFVVICEDLVDDGEPEQIAARLRGQLRTPFTVNGGDVTLDVSIGIARPDVARATPALILRASDEAMYAAKQASHTHAPNDGVLSARFDRDVAGEVQRFASGAEAMGDEIGTWHESLIKGGASDEAAFTSVLRNHANGELMITQYDRRAMLLRRYEWQHGHDGVRLTVYDWDDQPLLAQTVGALPSAPKDQASLTQLLSQVET